MYRNDINQSKLLGVFTALSIIIANIGLFGLVALLTTALITLRAATRNPVDTLRYE